MTIGEAVRYFESRASRYEIIVAADGTDGTREIVRDLARYQPGASGHRQRRAPRQRPRHPRSRRGRDRQDHRLCRRRQQGARSKSSTSSVRCWHPGVEAGHRHAARRRHHRTRAAALPARRLHGLPLLHADRGRAAAASQDTQCGFKFFQHDVAKELFRRQKIDGYMFDVEILAIARRLGYRIEQVPDPLARRRRQPPQSGERQPAQRARHFPDRAGAPVRRET